MSQLQPQPKQQDLISLSGMNMTQLSPALMPMNMNNQSTNNNNNMPTSQTPPPIPNTMSPNNISLNPSPIGYMGMPFVSPYMIKPSIYSTPPPTFPPTGTVSAPSTTTTTPIPQSPHLPPKSTPSSPPHSPRTKEKKDKEKNKEKDKDKENKDKDGKEEEQDFCTECSKKANRECVHKRCRGCCIKQMMETKIICLVHIKDESRRPRAKEHPHAETIQALINQAQQQFPNFNIVGSTTNTPAATPVATPSVTAMVPTATPTIEPLTLGVSPVIKSTPMHAPITTPTRPSALNLATPSTTSPTHSVATPAVPLMPPQPADGAVMMHHAAMAPVEQKQTSEYQSTHKAQSQFQLAFINMQAMYMQQISNQRLILQRDDKFAFFTCYKCQKEQINSDHNIFEDDQDILVMSKSKATERYNERIEWLEDLFSPSPAPVGDDKAHHQHRKSKIIEFQQRVQSLMDSFASQVTLDSIMNESTCFDKYFSKLSTSLSIDELDNIRKQYEMEKGIQLPQQHAACSLSALQPVPVSIIQQPKQPEQQAYYQFIESDKSFNVQSL
ncbi:hypothetical protein SAMD00019534_054340 [Acytostelium subglobosum LB1]|uniref:hypothetical protein n=1 Tax=Acytostelium subglobosum LB1 TaxID=1410327 RepID=UPI0006452091|nr:hypothetical protein SAMD00019534_054340 [Acytostelium subglobosum LB1]GAM22259.1 hypothetical protein SAMD00019534_054340 [Acytostelium subglobosum LB1]|eukprot:XP_012754379.1 hypothetical protein SAMD00019534_054340 [Acytostelium subglobosum LB1]